MSILENVGNPKDLKKLTEKQLNLLACELRDSIIEAVSKSGGHLSSNLGVVELTIALHKVFDSPSDRIIFDVGHQCYAHKMLTGRQRFFDTLRQKNGLSGYPDPVESPHDHYHTGHASTSLSLATGEVISRDLKGESQKVIAVVGDGSMTGGECFEAMNHLGHLKKDVLVVLNDNQMSISQSVGAMSLLISKFRAALFYRRVSHHIGKGLSRLGKFGEWTLVTIDKIKGSIKNFLMSNQYFEQLGYKYLGPVDGHDIPLLIAFLARIKKIRGPVLLHVITKKGKGCSYAETKPTQYHGTTPFIASNGESKLGGKSYSAAFGDILCDLAADDKKIVAITAAMSDGTGLNGFQKKFPKRLFDVGIAEPHAVTMAAALAKNGFKPVVAIYSTFLQRAFDQIIHDVALNNLPVVFAIDRAGLVPDDGSTHQGIFDLAYLSMIPNMTIMTPSCAKELEQMLKLGISLNSPCAIRYPKDLIDATDSEPVKLGKSSVESSGKDILMVYVGALRTQLVDASKLLAEKGISCEIINLRFIEPLDCETLRISSKGKKLVVCVEDGVCDGGVGQRIEALLGVPILKIAINKEFPPIGTRQELIEWAGLNSQSIANQILESLNC